MPQPSVQLGWSSEALEQGAARAAQSIQKFEHNAAASFEHLAAFSRDALSFVGIGVGLEGLKGVIDHITRINDLSKQLATTPEAIQRLALAAKLAGTDVETLSGALLRFNRALGESDDPKMGQALKELNIDAAKFLSLSPEKQLVALAEGFSAAQQKGTTLNSAFDVLGRTAGDLLPLLRSNAEALREVADTPVISDEEVARIAALNDQIAISTQRVGVWGEELLKAGSDGLSHVVDAVFTSIFELKSLNKTWEQSGQALKMVNEDAKDAAKAQADLSQKYRDAAAAAALGKLNDELSRQKGLTEEAALAAQGELEIVDKLLRAREKAGEVQKHTVDDPKSSAELRAAIELEKAKQEVLKLEKQYHDEVVKSQEEEQKKVEAAEKLRKEQAEALASYQVETAIIAEHAAGHDKKADAMAKAYKIAQATARIMKETGLDEEHALALAKERADAEDRLNKHKGAGAHHTHGFSQQQGSFRAAHADDGLGGFNRLQQGNFFDRHPTDYGTTRRAAHQDRQAYTANNTGRDHQPDLLRVMSNIDRTLTAAFN